MSGTWLERAKLGAPLKPADVTAGLRELAAADGAIRDAVAKLHARLTALEAKPEVKPEAPEAKPEVKPEAPEDRTEPKKAVRA